MEKISSFAIPNEDEKIRAFLMKSPLDFKESKQPNDDPSRFEKEKQREKLNQLISSQKTEKTLEFSVEKKRNLEKKISEILVPPQSLLYRLIWERAISISKSLIQSEVKKKQEQKSDDVADDDVKSETIKKIAESIVDSLLRRITLPLLKFLLTSEYRERLDHFEQEYTDLQEIDSSADMPISGNEVANEP